MMADSLPEPKLRALHSHGEGLLGLAGESGRALRAWTIGKGVELKSLGTWQLPSGRDWAAICAAEDHLYAVGTVEGAPTPEVWRFDLPEAIRALSGDPYG